MKIIAIDPGYGRLGIAILENTERPIVVFSCCFKTSATLPHQERLAAIGEKIKKVIKKYQPKELGIEKLFFNINQKTALKVAEARGVRFNIPAHGEPSLSQDTHLQQKKKNGRKKIFF